MVTTKAFTTGEAIRCIKEGTCPLCGGEDLRDGQWVPAYSKSLRAFSRQCPDCEVFLRVDETDYNRVV